MADTPKASYANVDDPAMLQRHCERRLSALHTVRSSFEADWRDLSDYILPTRGRFNVQANTARGGKRARKIINPKGALALRVLASGMHAGITSPSRPWFRLGLADSDLADHPNVKLWLGEVEMRMRRVLGKSNLYNMLHVLYSELGGFGTAVMTVLEDPVTVIRAQTLTAGEYYLAANEAGVCDTLYRKLPMSVQQLVERFGLDKVSAGVRNQYATGQYDKEIEVVHMVEPNPAHEPGRLGPKGMAYLSVYYDRSDTGRLLSVSGFHDCPFIAPRWSLAQNDVYGAGPGLDALPDVIALQVQAKEYAKALQKSINPPMVADGALKNEPASVLPGNITYVAGGADGVGKKFAPAYQINPNLPAMSAEMQTVEQRIDRAFYADLFLMISEMEGVQPRNQLEITKRDEEKLLQLGPVLERVHGEGLDPLIERVFGIMLRRGLVPPPPPELQQGGVIDVEYVSALAQAQKAVDTAGIERLWQFAGGIAAEDPTILDRLDADQTLADYADHLGVSPKLLRSDEAVAAIRQQRQQQQAMVQNSEVGLGAAKAAEVMSRTDVGGGQSALQKMLGT